MNMEKVCEFCRAFRPVVYCQADAAHLCLSCDAKVHSANALSNRHLRSPLCDSCHYAPAYARCSDHKMYICHSCDQRIHDPSSPHKRQATSSYMGSPSASDFAALWDLDLRELGDLARSGPSISSSPNELKHWGAITSDTSGLVCPGESNKGSRNQKRAAVSSTSQWNQSSCFILQQIIDLRKLQLDEKTSSSSLDDQEQNDLSSSLCHNSSKLNKTTDQSLPSCQDLKEEAFPSPFSTIENLPSSSTSGAPWHSESLWQCRSPFQTSQLWAQNMQDLGLCEELACHDDFNIPEVDVTFRNFEELFGGEQDSAGALLDDSEVTWSPVDKHISPNTSESGHANLLEDASMAASTCINSAALVHGNSDTGATDQVNTAARILDRSCFIHRSYSALSPSLSRFSSESIDVDCFDSSISTHNTMEGQACRLPNDEMIQMEVRETSMMSSIDKPRRQEERTQTASRRGKSDVRKRVKGRSKMGYDSDTAGVTRSN